MVWWICPPCRNFLRTPCVFSTAAVVCVAAPLALLSHLSKHGRMRCNIPAALVCDRRRPSSTFLWPMERSASSNRLRRSAQLLSREARDADWMWCLCCHWPSLPPLGITNCCYVFRDRLWSLNPPGILRAEMHFGTARNMSTRKRSVERPCPATFANGVPALQVVDLVRRHAPNALIHADASQAFGKVPVHPESLGVDLLSSRIAFVPPSGDLIEPDAASRRYSS